VNLYIHVPFCARRCSYCDFAIAVRRQVPSRAFADAILREWQGVQREPAWADAPALDTIYLGGGTPSHLAPEALAAILAGLRASRPVTPSAEVTLEANPDDVTREAAETWRAAGINRISLGVQSFDPTVLTWMHRTHTATQAREAVGLLRAAGFDNLSLDLIYALPPHLPRDWGRDLDAAFALEPDHLSCYGLTVEPHTPLSRWTTRGEALPADESRYAEEFLLFHQALEMRGWDHYEVSNAARPGRRAIHNGGYWSGAAFLGLGPSAHSAARGERWWNLREYAAWEVAIREGRDPVAGRERLTERQRRIEALYLGLRTSDGVSPDLVPAASRRRWEEAGWASVQSRRLRLSPEGWLRLDALVGEAA